MSQLSTRKGDEGDAADGDNVPLLSSPRPSHAAIAARHRRRSTAPNTPTADYESATAEHTVQHSAAASETSATAAAGPLSCLQRANPAVSPTAGPTLSPRPVPLNAADELELDALSLHPTLAASIAASATATLTAADGSHTAGPPLPALTASVGATARRKKTSRTLSEYCAMPRAERATAPAATAATATATATALLPAHTSLPVPLSTDHIAVATPRTGGRPTLSPLSSTHSSLTTAGIGSGNHCTLTSSRDRFNSPLPPAANAPSQTQCAVAAVAAVRLSRRTVTLSALPALTERMGALTVML